VLGTVGVILDLEPSLASVALYPDSCPANHASTVARAPGRHSAFLVALVPNRKAHCRTQKTGTAAVFPRIPWRPDAFLDGENG